jgi:hypothetical protein
MKETSEEEIMNLTIDDFRDLTVTNPIIPPPHSPPPQ